MKGVLLSIHPALSIIDISHSIEPQDVRAAAFLLAETTPWFPEGTLHVAVVDPGVGTDRRILYAEIGSQQYVVPDNGLLTYLADRIQPATIRVIQNEEHWLAKVSRTFHGRDIMAPVAARLSLGLDRTQLGPETHDFVRLPLPSATKVEQRIDGQVVEIDTFGNLLTNISTDLLEGVPRGERVRVRCGGRETTGLCETYADQPTMTLIALIGSGDKLELAIVNESAKQRLDIDVGEKVTVEW